MMDQDEDDPLQDVWEELLEEPSAQHAPERSSTQLGLKAMPSSNPSSTSSDYVAVRSHDLYDAFTARELTDRAHKPFTSEVELGERDVEDFFEELLAEMLHQNDPVHRRPVKAPSARVTRPTEAMRERQSERQRVRRQLLLWLLSMEKLSGAHRVRLPGEGGASALVVEGALGALVWREDERPWFDERMRREHADLSATIERAVKAQQGQTLPSAAITYTCQSGGVRLDEVARRALMEQLLRALSDSARACDETAIDALRAEPTQLSGEPCVFSPLDLFLLVDDHDLNASTTLPTIHFRWHEARTAQGWLLHHLEAIHPFDALIAHTSCTPHTLEVASRMTLLANVARQLLLALGFELELGRAAITIRQEILSALFDDRFVMTGAEPLAHAAMVIGALSREASPLDSRDPDPFEGAETHHTKEAICSPSSRAALLAEQIECSALCFSSSHDDEDGDAMDSWEVALFDERDMRARALCERAEHTASAIRLALEQVKLLTRCESSFEQIALMDDTHVALIIEDHALGRCIWLCRREREVLGMIRAQGRHNLDALKARYGLTPQEEE